MIVMVSRRVELVVVRHGETANNKARVLQGQLDTPLSHQGIRQAECVGKYLKDITFSHAISSDLSRALETGKAIVSSNTSLKGKEIELSTLLRERNFGELEGQGVEMLKRAIGKEGQSVDWDAIQDWGPSGGETGLQFNDRVRQFLTELGKKILTLPPSEDLRLLVTTHGGFISVMCKLLVEEYACKMPEGVFGSCSPNTGVTKFSLDMDQAGKIIKAECTLRYYKEHLKDLETVNESA